MYTYIYTHVHIYHVHMSVHAYIYLIDMYIHTLGMLALVRFGFGFQIEVRYPRFISLELLSWGSISPLKLLSSSSSAQAPAFLEPIGQTPWKGWSDRVGWQKGIYYWFPVQKQCNALRYSEDSWTCSPSWPQSSSVEPWPCLKGPAQRLTFK